MAPTSDRFGRKPVVIAGLPGHAVGRAHALFTGCGALMTLWLWLAWPMQMPKAKAPETPGSPVSA